MSLRVTRADGLVTVQDLGRPGYAHLGVPRAGALDAPAAALAHRLVGNDEGAALLEVTAAGLSFVTGRALTLAVTGAEADLRVAGRPQPWGEPVSVPAGAEVVLGRARTGVRSYLAVAGGVRVDPVLGSRATDTLAWIGPPHVESGRVLLLGTPGSPAGVATAPPRPREPVLRMVAGPRAGWLDDPAALARDSWTVGAASNRVGLRLDGRGVRRRTGELASEGVVLGGVQLPPDGRPVVFLHDHPATGGYPVVAVVLPEDLPIAAQARPGERLTLRWADATA